MNSHKQTNDDELEYHKGIQELAVMVATQQRTFDTLICKAQV